MGKVFVSGVAIMLLVVLVCTPVVCGRNIDNVKANAKVTLENAGYEIVGYEGFQWACSPFAGGRVWYIVKRNTDTRVLYNCYLEWWFGEYHIYSIQAIDALKPN